MAAAEGRAGDRDATVRRLNQHEAGAVEAFVARQREGTPLSVVNGGMDVETVGAALMQFHAQTIRMVVVITALLPDTDVMPRFPGVSTVTVSESASVEGAVEQLLLLLPRLPPSPMRDLFA